MSKDSLRICALALFSATVPLFSPPTSAQASSTVICGAETGKVYLREKPSAASQNANRTLKNGTPVQVYDDYNEFVFVKTKNGLSGWVTARYVCQTQTSNQGRPYICGAETGQVYLREKPSAASQNANRTIKNGTSVATYDYQNGFFLVKTRQGLTGWVTERYICFD